MLVVAAAAAATLAVSQPAAAEDVKLGTLAPKASIWGAVFNAWAKAVETESNGALKLTWYYNSTQGDEIAMIGKMRGGQLDGGAFTATGLSQIYPSIIALQMPGLFPDWAKLDKVRNSTSKMFSDAFAVAGCPGGTAAPTCGFKLMGTGDVGIAHIMSRDAAVRTPDQVKAMNPFSLPGDAIGKHFLRAVGAAGAKTIAVPAILPALSSRAEGAPRMINTPALAAEQLQWASQLNHINTNASGIGIGALVMTNKRFNELPEDARAVLKKTGQNTGQLLTTRIRAADAAAFNRLKASKTVVDLNDAEKAKWNAVFQQVREALKREGDIKGDVYDAVVKAAQ
ncbi:MAG: TRAP transporter substrate-binding protein DctP [Polyangiaceae bacterium]